jgi:glycosyltransferase involved in cell wall biosynthesis
MRRVLMIHYNFPPLGGMGSVRAVGLARYLPEAGWTPVVIAPQRSAHREDSSLVPSNQEVWRTNTLEWSVVTRAFGGPAHLNGDRPSHWGWGAARGFVHRLFYIPDGQIGWYPFAIRAARAAVRERKPDVLFSSSPPVTGHLVARRLSRETGIPWVAEFRDLWTDWRRNGRWRQSIDERIERSLLRSATATVTVSPTYERVLAERGAGRVFTITNGFDAEAFRVDSHEVDDVLSYVGTYYPQDQDLSTGLRAFAASLGDGLLGSFRFRIIGDGGEPLISAVRAAGIESRVECTGFVSHDQSIRLMSRSKVLLLAGPIGSTDPTMRGHVPGKTFEYLGSGRPILYVGDLESDAAAVLRPFSQARLVGRGDEAGARAALEALVSHPLRPSDARLTPYSHRELAGRLAGFLSEVAG